MSGRSVDIISIGCIVFSAEFDGRGVAKLTREQFGNAKQNGTSQSFEVFSGTVSEGKPEDLCYCYLYVLVDHKTATMY